MAAYRRVDDLTLTCRLTACTPGSAPGPTLGVEYGKPLPLPFYLAISETVKDRKKANKKSYAIYRTVPFSATLSDSIIPRSPRRAPASYWRLGNLWPIGRTDRPTDDRPSCSVCRPHPAGAATRSNNDRPNEIHKIFIKNQNLQRMLAEQQILSFRPDQDSVRPNQLEQQVH